MIVKNIYLRMVCFSSLKSADKVYMYNIVIVICLRKGAI